MRWTPDSWRQKPVTQMPTDYPDMGALHRVEDELRALPPLADLDAAGLLVGDATGDPRVAACEAAGIVPLVALKTGYKPQWFYANIGSDPALVGSAHLSPPGSRRRATLHAATVAGRSAISARLPCMSATSRCP